MRKRARTWMSAAILAGAVGAGMPALAGEPVDINTASAEELAAAIPGVGLTRARAIIRFRKEHGPFARVEDLTRVSGIGARTVERAGDRITVR